MVDALSFSVALSFNVTRHTACLVVNPIKVDNFHHISSQSLNLGGRRGTTDDVATIPFHPSLSSGVLRESPNLIPVHSLMSMMIFPSLLLPPSPYWSFHCLLQNCLRHARGSWVVAIPSEFPFLYHGKEIVMHSSCILDSVAKLLVRHMAFVGNVQKSPIASHLKGLEPSLDFCCHGPALIGIKEGE